jgi:hypothetical protein
MRRLIAGLSSLVLVITLAQPASAEDSFNINKLPLGEKSGTFQIGEPIEANSAFSDLVALDIDSREIWDQWVCTSTKDPACNVPSVDSIAGSAILPLCESDTDENCIVSLELAAKDQEFQPATYVRNIGGRTFAADPSESFFEQSTASLWEAPNAPSKSGTTGYAVTVRVIQTKFLKGNRKYESQRFFADVTPFREQKGEQYTEPYGYTENGDPVRGVQKRSHATGGGSADCAWTENGGCGVAQDFAEGTKVRLSLRIEKTIGGWFQARLKAPTISVSEFSKDNNLLVVEAEPTTVQRFSYENPDATKLSTTERNFVLYTGYGGGPTRFVSKAPAQDEFSFGYLNYFKDKVKDTAVGSNTFWSFSSAEATGTGSPCLSDKSKVLGIVTTNALIYDGGVPKFSRGFLNYRVAGLHYEADGVTEVLGTYDLVMRSDVARCLYGFSRAPVSATITIAGSGDRDIATTIVGEKNGWLKLAAYGFTFSEKTIRVKITQPRRTTINCVSTSAPTRTTKVSGISPKCPTGFRKR